MRKMFRRYHTCLIAIGFALLVWCISMVSIHKSYEKNYSNHINNEITLLNSMINSITNTYEEFSSYYYESSVNQPKVLDIIEEAGRSDDARQSQLRDQLLALLRDEYELLKDCNFRQLHFHLSNGDSFLRFHAPDQYGDNLLDVRESIKIANTEHRYVFGFEEGRVFNGYRFVYPLSRQGKHLGSVEVSVSLGGVIETLKELYPNNNLVFILKRDVVEDTVFVENQTNYIVSPLFEEYLLDKDVVDLVYSTEESRKLYEDPNFINIVRTNAAVQIMEDKPFGFGFTYLEKNYLVRFLPISNIKNVTVGYYLSITEDDHLSILKSQKQLDFLLVAFLVIVITGSFIALNRNRMKIQNMAVTDKLTGAFNRHYFVGKSEKELTRSIRYKRYFSILMLDIDHFKKVNDNYGHQVGDSVLIELSKLISTSLRTPDVFARWGGEEFITLLPETNIEQAVLVAERIRHAVEQYPFKDVGKITISLGAATLNEKDKDIDEVIKRADDALYVAKASGRNKVAS